MYTVKFRKRRGYSFYAVVRKQDHLMVSMHKSRDPAREAARQFNEQAKKAA